MLTIKMTIYKCEYCGKIYQRKFYCLGHEKKCRKNPTNDRPCFHCDYLEMQIIEYGDYDPQNGDYPYKGNALYCNEKKHFVFPPYVESPYDGESDIGEINKPMPIKCEMMV